MPYISNVFRSLKDFLFSLHLRNGNLHSCETFNVFLEFREGLEGDSSITGDVSQGGALVCSFLSVYIFNLWRFVSWQSPYRRQTVNWQGWGFLLLQFHWLKQVYFLTWESCFSCLSPLWSLLRRLMPFDPRKIESINSRGVWSWINMPRQKRQTVWLCGGITSALLKMGKINQSLNRKKSFS